MHRKPWFKEKYSPAQEMADLRGTLKAKGREGRLDRFLAELEDGKLDELSFDLQRKQARVVHVCSSSC